MASRDEFDYQLSLEIPHLRRYARALCRNPTEADDLVQDCLERALAKWRLWRSGGSLRSWLLRMLYRQFLNQRRDTRSERAGVSLEELLTPPSVAEPQADAMRLRDTVGAIRQLPPQQRDAVLLLALEDLSYEEAAWVMNIPVGTLRSRVSRGREALREALAATPDAAGQAGSVQAATAEPALRRIK